MSTHAPLVVFITGGASGIGAQCARKFNSEGYHVVVADINADLGQGLAKELSSTGSQGGVRAIFASCNVTKLDHLEAAVAKGKSEFGRIDIAIK